LLLPKLKTVSPSSVLLFEIFRHGLWQPRKRLYVKRKPKPAKKTCLATDAAVQPTTSLSLDLTASAPGTVYYYYYYYYY